MKKVLENGTRVLIFKYVRGWSPNQDNEHYISGVIKSSKLSDDLSCHGSPYYEQIYFVLGDDGEEYYGVYGRGLLGNAFFRTIEDHITYLETEISQNNNQIKKLENINNRYKEIINDLERQKLESIIEKISKEKIYTIIDNYSKLGILDIAYIYYKDENNICLLLAYSDSNKEIEMLANHGVFIHNFDEKNNINLKIYAISSKNIIDDFSLLPGKIIYDRKGILDYNQHMVLNRTLKSN